MLMKKILLLAALAASIATVNAQTKCTLGGQSANGNWSWGTNMVIGATTDLNFGSQWAEMYLTQDVGSAVSYKLTVAEANSLVNIVVKATTNEYIAVSDTVITGQIPEGTTCIELQGTEAGLELSVKSFVLVAADGTETQTTYASNWGVAFYGGVYTSTNQWAQIMVNGAESDAAQVLTVNTNAPMPDGIQLVVITADGTNYLPLTAGGLATATQIDTAAKEVSIQFTAADITLDIANVTTQGVESDAIRTIKNDSNSSAIAYDLTGRKVNGQKGLQIRDGKTILVK